MSLVLSLLLSLIAKAAPADPSEVASQLKNLGLKFEDQNCRVQSIHSGGGKLLSFVEASFTCGDLDLQIEGSYPLQSGAVQGQVETENLRIHEVYGASKNPYAGYISQTAQCPQRDNLFQERGAGHPLLVGRVTERGAWGACGKSSIDLWAAQTFIESRKALTKVRLVGKKPLERREFNARTQQLLRSLKVNP